MPPVPSMQQIKDIQRNTVNRDPSVDDAGARGNDLVTSHESFDRDMGWKHDSFNRRIVIRRPQVPNSNNRRTVRSISLILAYGRY